MMFVLEGMGTMYLNFTSEVSFLIAHYAIIDRGNADLLKMKIGHDVAWPPRKLYLSHAHPYYPHKRGGIHAIRTPG
jgi:hypothetical protein